MNWTASLLRNELKKLKLEHQARLNLLTEASPDAQNYLNLEEKLKETESNLKASEKNLTDLKKQAENTLNLHKEQLFTRESQIDKLEKKITASKELIFNLRKEIRTNSLYYQQSLRTSTQDLKEQLASIKKELANAQKEASASQKELMQIKSLGTDQTRELKERGKLIAKLETITKNQQKELDLTNSKSKNLQVLFSQMIETVNKGVFIRKKDLKETISQIQELMEWKGMVSVVGTTSATPNPEEE